MFDIEEKVVFRALFDCRDDLIRGGLTDIEAQKQAIKQMKACMTVLCQQWLEFCKEECEN